MSRFGWAYVSSVLLATGTVANGPTGSLQFHNSSQTLSGSPNLTYNVSSGQLVLTGTMIVSGTLYATEYHTNIVSSSIIYSSGSTKFGDDAGDTHQFTGSVLGDIVSGTIARFTTISGSNITGTFAGNGTSLTGLTASNISNFTNDVRGQFSAGTGIAINAGVISASSVPNSSLQNSSLAIGTTSISLGATGSTIQGLTTLTSSNVTGATAQFTTISASLLSASSTIRAGGAITGSGISSSAELLIGSTSTFAGTATFNGNVVLGDTLSDVVTSNAQITASNGISGSTLQFTTITGSTITSSNFVGNGQNINNITASNINNFTNDVRAQFTPGTNITIVGGVISSTGGGGTPGGADTQVQFNSGSTFSGSSNLIYDYTNNILSGTTAKFTTISGSTISSSNFVGNGFSLSNLTASNITNFTNDVRGQFTPGTNITIVGGVISSTGGSTIPGGTNTTIQFNSGSTFSGSSNLIYDYTNNILSGTTAKFTTISGSTISSSNFVGNGFSLSNLTASNITNFTNDVRGQFTPGTNITIVGGVISSTGGSTIPGGTNTTIQFNSGSTFSGSTNLVYDYTTNILSGTTAKFTTLSASFVSASSIAGYAIGTNVQAYDATLAAIAGASTAADTYIYFTATDTAAVGTVTSFARTLLDDTSNTTARTTLGLGTIATQDASSVAITSGSINNTTIGATTQNTGQFTTLSASSTLQVGGATTIGGNLNVNGGQTTVQSFTASAGISSSAGLIVGGSTRILGNVTFDSNLVVSGNTTLGNASSDIITVTGQLTSSGGIVLQNAPFSFSYLNVTTNHIMTTASCIIGVSASAPLTITLPSASATTSGRYFIVKDEAGNSATNNITISCSVGSGDTIDNLSSSVINVNNGSYTIYRGGANRYYIV